MATAKPQIVTIDGPSASGKSSVSREIARRLGWAWVSTGAFYRGLAFVARSLALSLDDEKALVALAEGPDWAVRMGSEKTMVVFRGKDVTEHIYSEEIGADASRLSHYPLVRKSLLQAQRDCANHVAGLVAEGRDCGTVVFPDAPVKIYLTAQSESRAARRAAEEGKSVEETKAAQSQRDRQDSTRQSAPLQIPAQAHVVDTSNMNLAQVVDHIAGLVQATFKL